MESQENQWFPLGFHAAFWINIFITLGSRGSNPSQAVGPELGSNPGTSAEFEGLATRTLRVVDRIEAQR